MASSSEVLCYGFVAVAEDGWVILFHISDGTSGESLCFGPYHHPPNACPYSKPPKSASEQPSCALLFPTFPQAKIPHKYRGSGALNWWGGQ